MVLDNHSLLLAAGLVTLLCAVARILLWRLHPALPGLLQWAWASIIGLVVLSLMTAVKLFPSNLTLSVVQALIALGFFVLWDGFRCFLGRPRFSRPMLAVIAAVIIVPAAVNQIYDSLAIRVHANGMLVALISGLVAHELIRARSPDQKVVRAAGWLYAANAVYFLFRAAGALSESYASLRFNESMLASLSVLWWLCITVAATLLMTLMTGERLQADLNRQASSDPLTGALNRRAFEAAVRTEMARAERTGGAASFLIMDLDHFKSVNDQLGHAAGDAILRQFVELTANHLRPGDILCRLGGEEFVTMLPGTAAVQAVAVAERIRAAFADQGGGLPVPISLGVSIGVGERQAGETLDEVLKRADAALYRAKADGRNRVELADRAATVGP